MSTITHGLPELPKTEEEWQKLALSILDRKPPKSYVEASLVLAYRVANSAAPERDYMQLVDNFNATSTRCTEILGQRRQLAKLIEAIAKAEPDARDELIAAAMTAAKGMQ